jgi:hypothetical protein
LPANIVLKPPGLVAECILSKFIQSLYLKNGFLTSMFTHRFLFSVFVSLFSVSVSISSSALRGVPNEQRCPGYRNNQCPHNPMYAKAKFCAPVGKKEAEEVECGDEEEEVLEEVEN